MLQTKTDLEKFEELFDDIGIDFVPADLLSGVTELKVHSNNKYTIAIIFDTLTGKFIEFEAY